VMEQFFRNKSVDIYYMMEQIFRNKSVDAYYMMEQMFRNEVGKRSFGFGGYVVIFVIGS
jgi:hypothetical protein